MNGGDCSSGVLRLTGREVRGLMTPEHCLVVVERAMKEVSSGNAMLPLRHGLKLPNGAMGMMPGYLGDSACFGIKLVSLFPENAAIGLPSQRKTSPPPAK